MKSALLLPILTIAFFPSWAQTDHAVVKLPAVPGLPGVIEAVLHDFPENLRHLTGELLTAQGETENYSSIVMPPGAESCTITRFFSTGDTTATWQARMYSNEDFEKASTAYHDIYRQLQSCYLLLPDSSMIPLKGRWEPARREMPFTTSTLRLDTGDERFREVAIDLELLEQVGGWVVNINVFNKHADDEIDVLGQ
jgi:hypothetical protein